MVETLQRRVRSFYSVFKWLVLGRYRCFCGDSRFYFYAGP